MNTKFGTAAILGLLAVIGSGCKSAPVELEPRVVLVTIDGLRWEEVFTGLDSLLAVQEESFEALAPDFWDDDLSTRRHKLMPWVWETLVSDGVMLGNRMLGSDGIITNGRNFSYPSYNELLSGQPDDRIDSNDKNPNPNVTVLEWLNKRTDFAGQVAAFGSWDVFPYILNEERSGIPVNAGFRPSEDPSRGERETFLNELQSQTPSPWGAVRLDVFTHQFALEYMKRRAPRVTYIAYGETDDFAHDADFEAYVRAAHRTDAFLEDLWNWIQAEPGYANNTTLIITTDHGRGSGEGWIGHGTGPRWAGSEFTWMAAMGPNIPALGEVADRDFELRQTASTVAHAVDLDFTPTGAAPAVPFE